jgi:hypothetical protein
MSNPISLVALVIPIVVGMIVDRMNKNGLELLMKDVEDTIVGSMLTVGLLPLIEYTYRAFTRVPNLENKTTELKGEREVIQQQLKTYILDNYEELEQNIEENLKKLTHDINLTESITVQSEIGIMQAESSKQKLTEEKRKYTEALTTLKEIRLQLI